MRFFVVLLLLAPAASAQVIPLYDALPEPQPYPSCNLDVVEFAVAPVGFENLHFYDGRLYLTAFAEGLYQATPEGDVRFIVKDDPARSGAEMMGVTSHDGALYVSQGLAVEGSVDARIIRFPTPGAPEFEVYVDGFEGGNGLVATGDGSLYLAHGFRREIYRIDPEGTSSVWAQGLVPNGLSPHPDGDRLVIGQVGEVGSGVEAWDLNDPSRREQLFAFNAVNTGSPLDSDASKPVVPHLMDDVAVTSDGRVLLTSHERMKTLMGDPATGEACVLLEHGDSPTSVRIATDFAPWNGYAFAVDLTGTIQAVDLGLESTVEASPGEDPDPESLLSKRSPLGLPLLILVLLAFMAQRHKQ